MPMGRMQKTAKIDVTVSQELWPYKVMNEIQKVMEAGEATHPSTEWVEEPVEEHVCAAVGHLADYLRDKGKGDANLGEDYLAEAFTRLMMAVAIERGYVDKKEEEGK